MKQQTNNGGITPLHLSSNLVGGAANAMRRLHETFLKEGTPSNILSPRPNPLKIQGVLNFKGKTDLRQRLARKLEHLVTKPMRKIGQSQQAPKHCFSTASSIYGPQLAEALPEADIYHLHWVADFVGFESLAALQKRAPLVWSLHDMNAFTGGCHYSFDCRQFENQCLDCPQLTHQNIIPKNAARKFWQQKKNAFARLDSERIKFVAPSRWIQNEARTSALLKKFDIINIPNGVDDTIFYPKKGSELKSKYNIPPNKVTLMLCAAKLEGEVKGTGYALEAIKALPDLQDFHLITVGSGSLSPYFEGSELNVTDLGRIDSEQQMAEIYSTADIVIVPSLEDNFPSVVLEAMACATPVIAFRTGGIPDMVDHNVTGLLVDQRDTKSLSAALANLAINDVMRSTMAQASRHRIEKRFSLKTQAEKIKQLYESFY